MKKFVFPVLLAVLSLSFSLSAAKVAGDWLILRVEKEGQSRELNRMMSFRNDGVVVQLGFEMATWEYQPEQQQIVLKSQLDKDFNGPARVEKLTERELVLEKDGMKYYLQRIHREAWLAANREAGLAGVWQSKNEEGETQYLKFDLPDEFTLVGLFEGGTSESHGTWMFQPESGALYVFAMTHFCDGKNRVMEQSDKEWQFTNNGTPWTLRRITPSSVDTLSFSTEEMPEGDPAQLPASWQNRESWFQYLSGVRQLNYRKGQLLAAVGVMTYHPLFLKVKTNPEENYLSFRFQTLEGSDTSQFKEEVLDGFDENPFFPEEEPPMYRVVGHETVTVLAGTFACTVVEAYDDFEDTKLKYWMIEDKPGVYARMIKSTKEFSNKRKVHLYELEKIR